MQTQQNEPKWAGLLKCESLWYAAGSKDPVLYFDSVVSSTGNDAECEIEEAFAETMRHAKCNGVSTKGAREVISLFHEHPEICRAKPQVEPKASYHPCRATQRPHASN